MYLKFFCIANKVPMDRFRNGNILKTYEYQQMIAILQSFIEKHNFLDEK